MKHVHEDKAGNSLYIARTLCVGGCCHRYNFAVLVVAEIESCYAAQGVLELTS